MRTNSWSQLFAAIATALLLACAPKASQTAGAATATATTPSTTSTVREKPATVSPQVAALLAPDPDLDVTLSKEEIRATLEAARQTAPPPVPSGPNLTATGDWQKMKKDQKKKNDQWKAYLQNTLVASNGGSYHTRSCSTLFRRYVDEKNRERTAYIGTDITLQTAFNQHLSRHAECGAPSYESHY